MLSLRRLSIALVILLALLGCNLVTDRETPTATPQEEEPAPENLLMEEATQIVLNEVVQPDALGDQPIIVFAWPDPLEPGDTIQPYYKEAYGPIPDPTVIEHESWFFWVDDAPGAAFIHPNRFVFVDRESAAVSVSDESWWPVLNGQGLWVERQAYWDETNWIFSNFAHRPEDLSQSSTTPIVYTNAQSPPQGESPGSAIIINGWEAGESLKEDFATSVDQMHDSLTQFGFDTTYLGPPEDTNPDRNDEPTIAAKVNWFRQKAEAMKPGETLMIYVTGHGGVDESGNGGIGNVFENFLKEDLQLFDPGVHIVVILDSCHCGSFVDSLREVADVTITSTSESKSAYGDVDGIDEDKNSGDRGMEYTSGWVDGFRRIMLVPEENARVQQLADEQGGNFWVTAASESHKAAVEKDLAAQRGWSEPQIAFGSPRTRPAPTPAPSPTSIPESESTAFFSDDPSDVQVCGSDEVLVDLEVDLIDFNLSLDSQQLVIQMNMGAPLVNDFSFAAVPYLIGEEGEIRAFMWETHDGVLRSGEVDPQNLDLLPGGSEDLNIEHNLTVGQIVFSVPIDSLPEDIVQIGFQSIHTPNEGAGQSCDSAGFYDLPPSFITTPVQPENVESIDALYDATLTVIEDQAQHEQPVGMWEHGQLHVTSTNPFTLTIAGPVPWVNTTGTKAGDGMFSTNGIGTVAGFPGIVVTFTGTITGNDLFGRYAMGVNGGLPTGEPIVFQVDGTLVDSLAPPTQVMTETVLQFVDDFNTAFVNQDTEFLFDHLHPAVFELYGAEQCQGYLQGVIDNLVQVEVLATRPSGAWQFERDGHSIPVDNAYTVEANVSALGQSSEQEIHYAPGDDGRLLWFTDCGDPRP